MYICGVVPRSNFVQTQYFFFFLSSGGWGNIKLNFITLVTALVCPAKLSFHQKKKMVDLTAEVYFFIF